MKLWPLLRLPMLAIACASVFLVLTQALLRSSTQATPFPFPVDLPLQDWRLIASNSLTHSVTQPPMPVNGWRYQYQQPKSSLRVDLQYLIKTDGNVKEYIHNLSSLNQAKVPTKEFWQQVNQLQQGNYRQGIGSFIIYSVGQTAYLSSCIPPRGETIVNPEQFIRNSDRYDLQFNRLIPWLVGQQDLRDNRCLWAQLSMPLRNDLPTQVFKQLETNWIALLMTDLRKHFPPS